MIFCKYAIAARHTNPRENGKRYRRKATYTRQPRKKGGWPRSAIHTSAHRKRRSRSPTPACDLTGLSLSLMDCLRCSLLLRVGLPALLILNVPHFLHPAQPTHSPLRGVLSGRPDELTRGRVERDLLNEHPIASLALPPLALRCRRRGVGRPQQPDGCTYSEDQLLRSCSSCSREPREPVPVPGTTAPWHWSLASTPTRFCRQCPASGRRPRTMRGEMCTSCDVQDGVRRRI